MAYVFREPSLADAAGYDEFNPLLAPCPLTKVSEFVLTILSRFLLSTLRRVDPVEQLFMQRKIFQSSLVRFEK